MIKRILYGVLFSAVLSWGDGHFCIAQSWQRHVGPAQIHEADRILMGSAFRVVVVHQNADTARAAVESAFDEIARIESLISSWDSYSETSRINSAAGKDTVRVSDELFELIRRSLKVSKLSNGAFDISFQPSPDLWTFDKSERSLPDSALVDASRSLINWQWIHLDNDNGVYLEKAGMRIGFGGIGKGYAANMAMKAIKKFGVQGALVNAGGDVLTYGRDANGSKWPVAIADPEKVKPLIGKSLFTDIAIVTSGNYEKYFLADSRRYGHIIDPRTGWPVSGISSATVFCPDAELADALATTIFVLGVEEGIDLINGLQLVECFIVDDEGNYHTSSGL